MATDEDHNSAKAIADAVNEVSERPSLIFREEIELAKAEVSQKMNRLLAGAVAGGAAAVFVIFGVTLVFHGLSWLAGGVLPVGDKSYFWGFFIVAAVLFGLGGLAAMFAMRLFKKGSPPTPQMAIEEARKTREELSSS